MKLSKIFAGMSAMAVAATMLALPASAADTVYSADVNGADMYFVTDDGGIMFQWQIGHVSNVRVTVTYSVDGEDMGYATICDGWGGGEQVEANGVDYSGAWSGGAIVLPEEYTFETVEEYGVVDFHFEVEATSLQDDMAAQAEQWGAGAIDDILIFKIGINANPYDLNIANVTDEDRAPFLEDEGGDSSAAADGDSSAPAGGGEDSSSADSTANSSRASGGSTGGGSTGGGNAGGGTTTTATTSTDAVDNTNQATGATAGLALAGLALAGAVAVVSKRK